jgi:hypothetical protein
MGGTLNLIDLESGTVQASTRIQGGDLQHSKQQLGLQSIALFPPPPCPVLAKSCPTMGIGYGTNNDDKKNDSFAVLLTIRNKNDYGTTAVQPPATKSRRPLALSIARTNERRIDDITGHVAARDWSGSVGEFIRVGCLEPGQYHSHGQCALP